MSFYPDPNEQAIEVLFSQQINSPKHPPLYFNKQEVCSAAHHKHLGLIFESKVSFPKHISLKISIARYCNHQNQAHARAHCAVVEIWFILSGLM